MSFSEDARELLNSFTGYRYEGYSEFGMETPQSAKAVIEYEIRTLGNNMLPEIRHRLGLPRWKYSLIDDANLVLALDDTYKALDRRFGPGAVAIWFASRRGVGHYADPGSRAPSEYRIPRDALMITDLGPDGQLFVMTREDWRRI